MKNKVCGRRSEGEKRGTIKHSYIFIGVIPNEEKYLSPDIQYSQIPILVLPTPIFNSFSHSLNFYLSFFFFFFKYLKDIDESNVNEILAKIASLPKPCLVHCNVGYERKEKAKGKKEKEERRG